MKSKQAAGGKKQPIVVKDLQAKKNPKGGGIIIISGTRTLCGPSSGPSAPGRS